MEEHEEDEVVQENDGDANNMTGLQQANGTTFTADEIFTHFAVLTRSPPMSTAFTFISPLIPP